MADPIGKLISISWWRSVFTRTGRVFGWGCAAVFGIPLVIGFGWSQYSRNQPNGPGATKDAVIMTVNGQPVTQGEYYAVLSHVQQTPPPGPQFATLQGQIMNALVSQAVIQQEAKKEGVRPSDADIDRELQTERETRVGKNAPDSDWESYVEQRHNGMSVAEYRESVATQLLGKTLLEAAKNAEPVTQEDAKNQSEEVKLREVLIPILNPASPIPPSPKGPKPLPDAEAQKKASDLLAQVQGGADLSKIARANSGDPGTSSRGGDSGWMPEYAAAQGMPGDMGVLGFGKEFDAAVHKTQKGGLTPIIKAGGFMPGYIFARVEDRRNNLPKDFNAQKVMADLKERRAVDKLTKLVEQAVKTARVTFPDSEIEKKAYYDYFKFNQMQQDSMMGQIRGVPNAPTQADVEKQKALVDREFALAFEKNKTDTTLALMAADALKTQQFQGTPDQQAKVRDQLISIDQTALQTTEGDHFSLRFDLADLYKDKKQYKEADKEYKMIARLLDADQPTDLASMRGASDDRKKLMAGLRSITGPDVPDAAADADAQQAKIAALQASIQTEQAKEAADQKLRDDAQKALNGKLPQGSMNLSPGSSGTSSVTIPATGGASGAAAPGSRAPAQPTPAPVKPGAPKP